MQESSSSPRSRKAPNRPQKPYDGFPLTAHPSGVWCKRIRGRLYYFGRWAHRVNGQLVRIAGDGWEEAESDTPPSFDRSMICGRCSTTLSAPSISTRLSSATFSTSRC